MTAAAPTAVTDASIPRRATYIAHELPETGETVVCDSEQRELIVLNPTGAAIWYLIDGARSVAEIAQEVAEHASIARERALTDTLSFVAELVAKGAVELA